MTPPEIALLVYGGGMIPTYLLSRFIAFNSMEGRWPWWLYVVAQIVWPPIAALTIVATIFVVVADLFGWDVYG